MKIAAKKAIDRKVDWLVENNMSSRQLDVSDHIYSYVYGEITARELKKNIMTVHRELSSDLKSISKILHKLDTQPALPLRYRNGSDDEPEDD